MAVMYSQNGVIVRKVDKEGPIIEPSDPNYVRLFSFGSTASSRGPRLVLSKSFKGFEIETVVKTTRFQNRFGWLFRTANAGLNFQPSGYYHINSNGQNYQGSFGGNDQFRLLYIRTRYNNGKLEGLVKFGSDPGNVKTVNFDLDDDGDFTNSSLTIFGPNDNSTDKCSMSIVYLKIFEGQEVKLALVPVYDIQNSTYKFYDAITDSYFNIAGDMNEIVTDFGMNLIH